MKKLHTLLLLPLGVAYGAPGSEHNNWNHRVRAGHSIQKVINKAAPGDKIFVEPGTYNEQLTITTCGLTIVGKGAMLQPPSTMTSNTCSGLAGPGTQAGICIAGTGVHLDTFVVEHARVLSVDKPVLDVTIEDFEISGFDLNIAAVGAHNTHITSNTLKDGAHYGFLSDGSSGTVSSGNVVTSSLGFNTTFPSIALCNDNTHGRTTEVARNSISGYQVGLCVQTNYARFHNNKLTGNCIGAFVDPYVKGVNIYQNHFGPSDPACGFLAVGIILSGTTGVTIRDNTIDGQKAEANFGAGLAIVDDPCTEIALSCLAKPNVTVDASRNVVKGNTFSNNDLDIYLNTTLKNDIVTNNNCSTPSSLCQ